MKTGLKCYQTFPHIAFIVLDNAPYYAAKVELLPRKGWRKQAIRDWLTAKNIEWQEDMIIAELLKLVEPLRTNYDVRRIDKIANEAGHTILWLPPYHCELNIIEMVGVSENTEAKFGLGVTLRLRRICPRVRSPY